MLTDIALDADGTIIGIDPGIHAPTTKPRILKIDPETGNTRVISSSAQFHSPTKLAIGEDGDIYISDLHADPLSLGITTGTIFKLSASTNALTVHATGTKVSAPFGLTLGNAGDPSWQTSINAFAFRILKSKTTSPLPPTKDLICLLSLTEAF
jgi:hypothetical protein